MKYLLSPFVFLLLLFGIFRPGSSLRKPLANGVIRNSSIAMCGTSGVETIGKDENGKFVVALPGWGNYSYKITTASDSAQFYFNQGLNMYYSYHMKEANASFHEASRFDPGNAMAYWGQALAMGPYYNAAWSYAVPEGIKGVLLEMNKNMGNASPSEKHLIKAMNTRYPAEIIAGKTKALDLAYAKELRQLVDIFPEDPDIKMLYIDAVMLMHAWDFWNQDGTAKEWTPEVVDLCARVLKFNPQHPAALHYYIHLTEASRQPEVALANADALKKLLPGVAHMVHMASHEYQRNGLYANGVEVNDKADDALMNYESLAKNLSLGKHSPHYFAVQSYCSLTGAMYQTGIKNALRCRKSVLPTHAVNYDQFLFMMPSMTMIRSGKWNEILKDTVVPDQSWSYAMLLHHFAKGIAYASTGKSDSASHQLSLLRKYAEDPILKDRRIPFNSPVQMAGIAEKMLDAAILFAEKKSDAAIASLTKAIELEDGLIYTEPNDWPLPARQLLGVYLLKLGKRAEAKKVYQQDLVMSSNNGWSLLGLYQCAKAAKNTKEMSLYKARYLKVFAHADKIPPASFYIN